MCLPLQNKSAYSKMQREHETLVSQLKQLQIFKEQAQTDSKDVGQLSQLHVPGCLQSTGHGQHHPWLC